MKEFRYIIRVEKLVNETGEGLVIKAIDKLAPDDISKGYNIAFECDTQKISDQALSIINTSLREMLESILINDCILNETIEEKEIIL